MSVIPCLVDRWSEENNNIMLTWKQNERGLEPNQHVWKRCWSESLKLLQKIQGIPAATERLELEMTVSYNTFLFSLNFSNASEIEESLTNSLLRALEAGGSQVSCSDPVQLWEAVLQTFGSSVYVPYVHKLLLIQWMLWLMQCQLEKVLTLLMQTNHKSEHSAPVDLQTETRNLALSMEEDSSLKVAMAAKDLKDLLHICTVMCQGVEQMKMEKYSEALGAFQEAKGLPSPRSLLAQIHTLTGQSFAKLGQPHCALHFYRKSVEVDCACHSALYQSALVFRQLGNPKAEMEALHLLYSAVQLQSDKSSSSASLVSPAMLFGGVQMTFISRVPSPSLILHTLAHTCVVNGSISDGVEYYLDLLASLQSDGKDLILTGDGTSFPRIPVVYLEAGFALLKAKRYCDALVVCEEVITSTLAFIPERLLLDADEKLKAADSDVVLENVDLVLWAGAAHLLQAQAHWKLKDTKEAITNFTRAINQLVKVFIKQKDWKQKHLGNTEAMVERMVTVEAAKGQALASRGLCFLEGGQLKEALRDFNLSLQMTPGCKNTEMWLTEVLWRLDRREEASAHWREAHSTKDAIKSIKLPLYLQLWPDDTAFDFSGLKKKMEEYIQAKKT
ncbi:Fanconi anemia group G protein homolog [Sinocyclocheilus rhinocerous]|uniref:Fanconi anemia group G protein homolog n=1 Tax=Sinocyclocheilus rhinocerous TaxID=307959 RepID=A0A673KQ88_9TELE|nr:PREDICTED: Fanconi anemia group G protein homolog [Sinocyclocheilus rhinocerous]